MYQEVCFNRGTEAGGGVNVGHSLSPSSRFMLATGLDSWACNIDIGSVNANLHNLTTAWPVLLLVANQHWPDKSKFWCK